MVPLVYHPRYNITAFGLERLHKFDSTKYRRIRDALVARGLRKRGDLVRPRPMGRSDLLKVHTPAYLDSLHNSAQIARILEVPVAARLPAWLLDWRILRSMRYAAAGTVLAARLAREHGVAINLGGGFHHAAAGSASGFCVYADIPLAAWILHDEGLAAKVLVVDLDAHQGNGTAATIRPWPWASILDVYQETLFPIPKEPEDFPVPLAAGTAGSEYLDVVRETLPKVLDVIRPELVLYNAGSDPFVDDPLAGLRLSMDELADRDLLVVDLIRERSIPVAMLLSGGYSPVSWKIHADSIEGILTRFDRPAR
jgi:histone deacetylase 11